MIEHLRLLVESAPPDATVPVRWIGELLDQDDASVQPALRRNGSDPVMPDLSVNEIMQKRTRG